jgi:putative hemolysin
MNPTVVSVLIVLALILAEALFVAAEIALVTLRQGQVQALEASGKRGAVVARLVRDPNQFLATVQIGVTLTSLLSSAYGAITISESAKRELMRLGLGDGLAGFIGVVGVTLIISFVTLVIGELAPKRIALQRTEGVAKGVAPLISGLALLCRPAIWLISVCTNFVVLVFGGDPRADRQPVSEEELRHLLASADTLSGAERELIDEVFDIGDRQLREVLVPRTEVEFLDATLTAAEALNIVASQPHSRYPVTATSYDDVIGFVHVRDLVGPGLAQSEVRLRDLVRPVKMLPATKQVLAALSEMRNESIHLAIVVDEYGGTAGIVTMEDLLEEIIGDIRDEYDVGQRQVTRLTGGDLELDGLLNLDGFADETGIELPHGPYETIAGYLVARLAHLPEIGESVRVDHHRLTVVELDGHRVARVRLSAAPEDHPEDESEPKADQTSTSHSRASRSAGEPEDQANRERSARDAGTSQGATRWLSAS